MTVQVNMEGDTAKGKMKTNATEGNIICKGWGRKKHKLHSVVIKMFNLMHSEPSCNNSCIELLAVIH